MMTTSAPDMDIYTCENIKLYTKVKELCFSYCSTIHNRDSVFNNEHTSCHKICVKWPLANSLAVLFFFTSADNSYILVSLLFRSSIVNEKKNIKIPLRQSSSESHSTKS